MRTLLTADLKASCWIWRSETECRFRMAAARAYAVPALLEF